MTDPRAAHLNTRHRPSVTQKAAEMAADPKPARRKERPCAGARDWAHAQRLEFRGWRKKNLCVPPEQTSWVYVDALPCLGASNSKGRPLRGLRTDGSESTRVLQLSRRARH